MLGFHLQRPINGWIDACKRLPDGTPIKFIDNVQALHEIKSINPKLFTVLRHFYDNRQVFGGDYEHRKNVAREFFATFIDGTFANYAPGVDAIEDWNEYLANSQNQQERNDRILHARAMADVWSTEYRTQQRYAHIRLVLANAAIGNDIPVEFAAIAQQYDCILGYHAYIHYVSPKNLDPLDWRYHSGRWAYMDAQYKAAGYHNTRWVFTEGGPYVGVYEGWKHEKTCVGDVNCYMSSLEHWLNNAHNWNKENNGRAIGLTLYNSGDDKGQWKYFENDAGIMNRVADLQVDFEPVEPPIEPPVNDDGLPRVQYKRVYLTVPQNATEDEWLAICKEAYKDKNTVGFSYDDAGIGKLDDKTAVLYGIDNQQLFVDWFAEHYPGTELEFRNYPKV